MTQIEAKTIRAYYNAGNDNEPFCVDFGPGTLSLVCKSININGSGVFKFDVASDPKAWIEFENHILVIDLITSAVGIHPWKTINLNLSAKMAHQNSVTE